VAKTHPTAISVDLLHLCRSAFISVIIPYKLYDHRYFTTLQVGLVRGKSYINDIQLLFQFYTYVTASLQNLQQLAYFCCGKCRTTVSQIAYATSPGNVTNSSQKNVKNITFDPYIITAISYRK